VNRGNKGKYAGMGGSATPREYGGDISATLFSRRQSPVVKIKCKKHLACKKCTGFNWEGGWREGNEQRIMLNYRNRQRDRKQLNVFERKVYGRILGPV